MANDEMSVERRAAYYKFREAQQAASHNRLDEAIGLAHDALEEDPTYTEVRHWMAELYVQHGQTRKASAVYQEILHEDREDQKAWEAWGKSLLLFW